MKAEDCNVTKVAIDGAVIEGEAEPLLIYENNDNNQEKLASSE